MKKSIVFFAFLGVLLSSFTIAKQSQDPLIGTWKYYKTIVNGESEELILCEGETTFQINKDGSFKSIFFEENFDNENECIEYRTEIGVWENEGDNFYSTTIENERTITQEVYFENDTFYFQYTDIEGTHKSVFKRQ